MFETRAVLLNETGNVGKKFIPIGLILTLSQEKKHENLMRF